MQLNNQKEKLIEFANYKMPFGKFKNYYLVKLPEEYLIWFSRKGFPKGKLGELLQLALEIRQNGLEHLILPLIKKK